MATRPNVMIIPSVMLEKAAKTLERDCANCIHTTMIADHEWECTAEQYDIDGKMCFEPKE